MLMFNYSIASRLVGNILYFCTAIDLDVQNPCCSFPPNLPLISSVRPHAVLTILQVFSFCSHAIKEITHLTVFMTNILFFTLGKKEKDLMVCFRQNF